jgi:hypothetical protein
MKAYILIMFACVLVCGCASPSVYKEVMAEKTTYNQKEYAVSQDALYCATLKAICGKNFIIDKEGEHRDFILARRMFQKGRKTIALIVQGKIISTNDSLCTLYLSALESAEREYVADRTRFFLFLIPLPGGGGKEASKIKVGEKIIQDKEFYDSLFKDIDVLLQPTHEEKTVAQEKGVQQ